MRRLRRGALAATIVTLAVAAATVPVARAQEAPEPAQEVIGVLSPLANPVCNTAGASTLLVPILGGLVEDQLALGQDIDIADVVLDAMGPVFVTCASLPAPDGTRCEVIDDQVLALWPQQVADAGLTAPNLGGNLVEAVGRLGRLLGLDLGGGLQEPLRCSLPAEAEAPAAPPAPPPPPPAPPATTAQPAIDTSAPVAVPRTPNPAPMTVTAAPEMPDVEELATPTPAGTPATMTVTDVVARSVPGGVVALQVLVGLALVAFLLASWTRSAIESRQGA